MNTADSVLRMSILIAALSVLALSACRPQQPPDNTPAQPLNPTPTSYNSFKREDFNRRAAEKFLPLFWSADANRDGALQADELAVLWGYGDGERNHWVNAQQFTAQFNQAYQSMLQADAAAPNAAEQTRHAVVLNELAQGRTTLVQTDLSKDSAAEVNMVRHLMNAAALIERIYARQKGVLEIAAKIPADDTAGRMLFHRNQSPFCEAPKTEKNEACGALAAKPARIVGLYPAALQSDSKFCEALTQAPNAQELMGHFNVVVASDDSAYSFKTLAYNEAYKEDMQSIAMELDAAANGLGADETAFKTYLLAAAQSFRSNDWEPANRAWVAMNPENSKWYARIAPDEVYYEPCAWKAGFALQLARINPDSLAWRKKLDPLKNEMERTLATLAGPPYKARDVQFKLPDFIDVVLNAGDQRAAHGATIGQSLPNWGPVAESGGRTVAMTNLYTDADSQAQLATQMSSLFCKATNAKSTATGKESLISSLLHEAAHNLGPSHEYKVGGKVDSVAFGGPLASTLEELKAQTSSMFLTNWLMNKGVFTQDEVDQIQLRNVAWGFGHISRGMYAADGMPRNYSQLAAIQLGSFVASGAVIWKADEAAANGGDQGCLEIDFRKMPAAVKALETTVLRIKAKADKAGAHKLIAQFVDGKNDFSKIEEIVTERWLRAPKATFIYSLQFN